MRRYIAVIATVALASLAAPAPAQVQPTRGPLEGQLFAAGTTNLTNGIFFPGTATCDKDGCTTVGDEDPLQVQKGSDVTFTNLDAAAVANGHRIVSLKRKKKTGRPVFFSDMVNGPDQTTIETSKLKPGVYYYLCTTHFGMYGALEVYKP